MAELEALVSTPTSECDHEKPLDKETLTLLY